MGIALMSRFFAVRWLCLGIGVAILGGMLEIRPAAAQSSRPAVSPYLMLRDRSLNTGGMSAYHQFIKPRQEYDKALQQQATQLRRTQSATREIENQMMMGESGGPRPEGNGLLPPGAAGPSTGARGGAAFRNHKHWYTGISGDPTPRGLQR